MDSSDPAISFFEDGSCNHCTLYLRTMTKIIAHRQDPSYDLKKIFEQIKFAGRQKQYDCIVGVSGGVDSSYIAWLCQKEGLRPLLVHLDNGWNSELAVKNIQKIIEKTNFDLHTHVINWEEFKDLQRSFFKASVIDIELLSDHAIFAVIYRLALKFRIRYVLSGFNFATEGIMPQTWFHAKRDLRNILDIHRKFGQKKLKTFPQLSTFAYGLINTTGLVKSIDVLNHLDYKKSETIALLKEAFDWTPYEQKHFESKFTRFYQGYILPEKFGVDKRRAHLSALICNGEISRGEALESLTPQTYDENARRLDLDLVVSKLGFSREEIEEYIRQSPRSHFEYKSDQKFILFLKQLKAQVDKFRGLRGNLLES